MKGKYLVVSLRVLPRVIGKIRKCFLHFMFSVMLLGYLLVSDSHSFSIHQVSWFVLLIGLCLCVCVTCFSILVNYKYLLNVALVNVLSLMIIIFFFFFAWAFDMFGHVFSPWKFFTYLISSMPWKIISLELQFGNH